MNNVTRMVNSKESQQTARFRWVEAVGGFWAYDSKELELTWLGDGTDLFCNDEGKDCLVPGTQRFYDALNGYFENEQAEVAKEHFGLDLEEEVRQVV